MGVDVYRRRFKAEPGGLICHTHWVTVPKAWRRVKARHDRELRKFGFRPRQEAYDRIIYRIWRFVGAL